MTQRRLARFRADPSAVRVAIRRINVGWLVSVTSRTGAAGAVISATGPRKALVLALRMAEKLGIAGVDFGMSWTYEHPQGGA